VFFYLIKEERTVRRRLNLRLRTTGQRNLVHGSILEVVSWRQALFFIHDSRWTFRQLAENTSTCKILILVLQLS